jgi:stalled ribosome alternative rescue factor ArfA
MQLFKKKKEKKRKEKGSSKGSGARRVGKPYAPKQAVTVDVSSSTHLNLCLII